MIKALLFAKDQKTLRYSVSFPTSVASATSQKSPDGECLVLQQAVLLYVQALPARILRLEQPNETHETHSLQRQAVAVTLLSQ